MTKRQAWLLGIVKETNGLNTRQLRKHINKNYHKCVQAYESSLRDRLFRLVNKKLIKVVEFKKGEIVLERIWLPID